MKCPICDGVLETTSDNEFYYMCYSCIVGWTSEELKGIQRYLKLMKKKQGAVTDEEKQRGFDSIKFLKSRIKYWKKQKEKIEAELIRLNQELEREITAKKQRSLAMDYERRCRLKAAEERKKGNESEAKRWENNAEYWVRVQTGEEQFSYIEEAVRK